MDRYKKSLEYLERALKVTPGGAQTLSKRAGRFPEGAYPTTLVHGLGAHVLDLDGNKYLDMICGLACMTLGYSRGEILQAVQQQLFAGTSFSLANPLEAVVAEKLCAMIPCAEMVRFVKTGSEANEAAIRVARKATGRDNIVTIKEGYHAWHSWFQVVKDEHPGIPEFYRYGVAWFRYNNLGDLESRLVVADVAAVIMEPCHYEQPDVGFLEGVRELCTKHGAILIFDEMVTGYRWANGGAQGHFGVTPDLATFGKACANGFPLAFLCGKRELMEHADVVSGTFGGEAMSLAACNAVLDIYKTEPIIETLWARGKQFQEGFNDLAQVIDVPAICDGFAVKPRIKFTVGELNGMDPALPWPALQQERYAGTNRMAMSLFLQETAVRGILWHPAGGNVSAAMAKDDIEFALTGMGEALAVVKKALETGDWSALHGKPIQSTPFVRKG